MSKTQLLVNKIKQKNKKTKNKKTKKQKNKKQKTNKNGCKYCYNVFFIGFIFYFIHYRHHLLD